MTAVVALPVQRFGALAAVLPVCQWDMLAVLNHHHPRHLTRREMMGAGGFDERVQGRLTAYTAFEFHALKLSEALRPHGWRLSDTNELYRLIKT